MPVTGVNLTRPVSSTETLAAAFASTACADAGCALDFADIASLLDGFVDLGVIDARAADRLRKVDSDEGRAAAAAIMRLREIVRAALEALRLGKPVPRDVLEAISSEVSKCGCRREVVRDGDGYRTQVLFEIEKPIDLLMPLANAIAETLVSVDPTRVKQCREPRCTCYFIDTSKNRTRTWCSMERCGNRSKVAAYYTRSRKTKFLHE